MVITAPQAALEKATHYYCSQIGHVGAKFQFAITFLRHHSESWWLILDSGEEQKVEPDDWLLDKMVEMGVVH